MPFKYISYLELWWPFCSVEQYPFVDGKMGNISVMDHWFRRRCHLKTFLSKTLVAHCFGGEKHLCNFVRGYHVRETLL